MKDKQPDDSPLDMDKMDYSQFESTVGDIRSPGFIEQAKVIRNSEIARRNISPARLAEYLAQGYVVKLHRSFRDELPLFILLAAVLGLIMWYWAAYPEIDAGGFPAELFLPLAIIGVILHRKYNSTYYIHQHGIAIVKGILKFYLVRLPLEYERMRAVEVGKNLLQRILNVGDIRISTQLIDQPEIIIQGIAIPYFYGTFLRTALTKFDPQGQQSATTKPTDD